METTYRLFNIIYDIEPEDLDLFEEDFEDEDEYNYACSDEIESIKAALPNEMFITIDEENFTPDELEDVFCDHISDETGWLIDSYEYEKVDIAS